MKVVDGDISDVLNCGMATPIRTARPARRKRRQPRPTGPYYPVDDAWKSQIKALLVSRGITQSELARKIDASPGSIVLIFKPNTVQSRLVPAIHEALKLVPPAPPATAQVAAA
jgi:hypothetical protein